MFTRDELKQTLVQIQEINAENSDDYSSVDNFKLNQTNIDVSEPFFQCAGCKASSPIKIFTSLKEILLGHFVVSEKELLEFLLCNSCEEKYIDVLKELQSSKKDSRNLTSSSVVGDCEVLTNHSLKRSQIFAQSSQKYGEYTDLSDENIDGIFHLPYKKARQSLGMEYYENYIFDKYNKVIKSFSTFNYDEISFTETIEQNLVVDNLLRNNDIELSNIKSAQSNFSESNTAKNLEICRYDNYQKDLSKKLTRNYSSDDLMTSALVKPDADEMHLYNRYSINEDLSLVVNYSSCQEEKIETVKFCSFNSDLSQKLNSSNEDFISKKVSAKLLLALYATFNRQNQRRDKLHKNSIAPHPLSKKIICIAADSSDYYQYLDCKEQRHATDTHGSNYLIPFCNADGVCFSKAKKSLEKILKDTKHDDFFYIHKKAIEALEVRIKNVANLYPDKTINIAMRVKKITAKSKRHEIKNTAKNDNYLGNSSLSTLPFCSRNIVAENSIQLPAVPNYVQRSSYNSLKFPTVSVAHSFFTNMYQTNINTGFFDPSNSNILPNQLYKSDCVNPETDEDLSVKQHSLS
ncbi:MAG: hypothetical protein Tsb005_15520 [Gammaproteobacteria bacterium]